MVVSAQMLFLISKNYHIICFMCRIVLDLNVVHQVNHCVGLLLDIVGGCKMTSAAACVNVDFLAGWSVHRCLFIC